MNHLRFNEFGELISKDIRGVVATSNEADEIFIFYDKDISTLESGYLASARMERCDGLKIGPINLTLTAKSFDTENKANNYGIPSWNDATEKWDVPCRLLKLTDEMLGVDGDLSLSVVYTEVLENGQKKVKVNQMVVIKVFNAVDSLYNEEQYNELLDLFLKKDLSGLTTADAVAGINEFIIKQVGETKLITAENLRLYAVAKIVDGSTIAKKAEQDANGNVITQTYLNKTTMTPQLVEANVEFNDGINMQDSKITNVGNATNSTDAVNKGQLDIKVEVEITKIIDGIYTVDKATNDKDGNRIDTTYEKVSRKNEISGYVGLDANKKIPLTYLYDGVLGQLEYGGVFNPSVGYPTDTNSLDTNRPIRKGDYFIANADGTAGGVSYNTGDWAIRSADNWQKIDNTDAVASVNGKLGVVVLDGTDIKVGNGDTATLQARFVAIDALINSRYTKSEVYNKAETDAIINGLKTMYGWEQTLIVEKLAQGSVHYVALTTLATLNEYDFVLFTLKFAETYYTKLLNPAHLEPQDIIFFEGDTYYKSMFVDEDEDTTIRFSHNMEGLAVVDVFIEGIKIAEQKAINITYDNVDSGLTAENVQEAIDELENEIDLKIKDIGLDTPIEKLENQTLREVFEDGQLLLNGDILSIDNWATRNVTNLEYLSAPADYIYFEALGQYGGIYNDSYTTTHNHKYYFRVSAMSWSGTGYAYLHNGDKAILFDNAGVFETKSIIDIATHGSGQFYYVDSGTNNFIGQHLRIFKAYDLTSLGISALTVEQMDYWFNIYQEIKEKSTTAYLLDALNQRPDELEAKKVDKTSIVDNLTTDDATKVLSAKQGKALQDTLNNHKNDYISHKLQDLENSRELLYGFEINANGVLNFVLKESE